MAAHSLGAALQNVMLAAHANGLASCWMCAPVFCSDVVREALGLPSHLIPHAIVTIGYPARPPRARERPARRSDRGAAGLTGRQPLEPVCDAELAQQAGGAAVLAAVASSRATSAGVSRSSPRPARSTTRHARPAALGQPTVSREAGLAEARLDARPAASSSSAFVPSAATVRRDDDRGTSATASSNALEVGWCDQRQIAGHDQEGCRRRLRLRACCACCSAPIQIARSGAPCRRLEAATPPRIGQQRLVFLSTLRRFGARRASRQQHPLDASTRAGRLRTPSSIARLRRSRSVGSSKPASRRLLPTGPLNGTAAQIRRARRLLLQ